MQVSQIGKFYIFCILKFKFPVSQFFSDNIVVHSRRQADERSRNMVIHTAIMWGWRDPCLTTSRREFIAKAACRQVAYDMGYPVPLVHTRLASWYGLINSTIAGGENRDPLSPSQSGRTTYIDIIEEQTGYENERRWRAGSDYNGGFGTFCTTGSRR